MHTEKPIQCEIQLAKYLFPIFPSIGSLQRAILRNIFFFIFLFINVLFFCDFITQFPSNFRLFFSIRSFNASNTNLAKKERFFQSMVNHWYVKCQANEAVENLRNLCTCRVHTVDVDFGMCCENIWQHLIHAHIHMFTNVNICVIVLELKNKKNRKNNAKHDSVLTKVELFFYFEI